MLRARLLWGGCVGLALVLLVGCGCHTAAPSPTYRFGGSGESSAVREASARLGESPSEGECEPIRGLLYEVSGEVSDRRAEQGLGVACLSEEVDAVVLLLAGSRTTGASSAQVPSVSGWETAAGRVGVASGLRGRLVSEGGCREVQALPAELERAVLEMALLLKVRFGQVELVPVALEGGGVSKALVGTLLREMFGGRLAVVGGMPSGTAAHRPGWRGELLSAASEGWRGQRVSLPELTVVELCRRLGMRGVTLTRPAVRGTRLAQAPDRLRDLELVAFTETPRSLGIEAYGREHGDAWATGAAVLGEVAKGGERVATGAGYGGDALNEAEQAILLSVARQALERASRGEGVPSQELPQYSPQFMAARGCSVTLLRDGQSYAMSMSLGGGGTPLLAVLLQQCGRLVKDASRPVTPELLASCRIEVGVMSAPRRLEYGDLAGLCRQLTPGRDGVILRAGGKAAGFVPQVWRQFRSSEEFLAALCRRCGVGTAALTQEGTTVSVFGVQTFRER